jgi:protein MpaA
VKHVLSVILVAGLGGAAWYYADPAPRKTVAKLQIPDPGPSDLDRDVLSTGKSRDWQPVELEPLVPLEPAPSHPIAEQPPRFKIISDEQPFAVSDPDDVPPVKRTNRSSPRAADENPTQAPAADTHFLSVEGRTIGVRRLGEGPFRTVIVTGLDGRDRTAVQWADDLADALEQRPDLLQQQEFVIIRAANPDGLAARTRENVHGVVLNRNFPTRSYRIGDLAGVGPASEPETRALLQTLYDVRPQRVVHIFSTTGATAAYVNSPAAEVADRLKRRHGIPVERLDFDRLPGSLEEFADTTWSSGVVRLHVRGVPDEEISRTVVPLLITAVSVKDRPGTVAPVSTPRREPSRWQTAPNSSPLPTAPGAHGTRRNRPPIRRGYEELPPPPE